MTFISGVYGELILWTAGIPAEFLKNSIGPIVPVIFYVGMMQRFLSEYQKVHGVPLTG